MWPCSMRSSAAPHSMPTRTPFRPAVACTSTNIYPWVPSCWCHTSPGEYPVVRLLRTGYVGVLLARVFSLTFLVAQRRLDSKLEFISKMSFAIRQRFGILSGGAENFLHELTESLAAGAADMENTMKDVMESCSISKAVLDDFSVCESIINGEARLAAKDTAIFVEVKRTLAKFYADHVRLLCVL